MSYPKVLFLAINFTLSKNKEMMNFGRKIPPCHRPAQNP